MSRPLKPFVRNGTIRVQQEMALLGYQAEMVGDECLDGWQSLEAGGFGHVYKARHKQWGFDVAIKILHNGVCPIVPSDKALYKEASNMEKVSCEFVLRIYGLYQGCHPLGVTSKQLGIVMEFMERGSLDSLLTALCGPPPWPLAFRLAHQIALGMNFLHSRKLVHKDLKPNNVLLSEDLNAKIADFGLSRVSASVLNSRRETQGLSGGSCKYMPPEAFDASYRADRAYDRYSYGILLWTIFTGEEPYPAADYSLVALRIPLGDRPPCGDIDVRKAEGLKDMVDLMKNCWEKFPFRRKRFGEVLQITEEVFSKHKKGIHDAVHEVLTILDPPTNNQPAKTCKTSVSSCRPLHTPGPSKVMADYVRPTRMEPSSVQRSGQYHPKERSNSNKAAFIDKHRAQLIQDVSEVMVIVEELGEMVHSQTYSVIEAQVISQDKMRALYQRTLRPGGVKAKAAFYDALKKHHPTLMERLGGK